MGNNNNFVETIVNTVCMWLMRAIPMFVFLRIIAKWVPPLQGLVAIRARWLLAPIWIPMAFVLVVLLLAVLIESLRMLWDWITRGGI
jgi:hypothetical protein